MARIALKLLQLQGNAHCIETSRIKGPRDLETIIWQLTDGTSIEIGARSRTYRGNSAAIFETAVKRTKPLKVVAANVKRQYTRLRRQEDEEGQLCI
jgi:hypothetical protein